MWNSRFNFCEIILIRNSTWPPGDHIVLFFTRLFFKRHLLRNRKAEVHQTWWECSSGDPLSKLFKTFLFDIQDGYQAAILKLGMVRVCSKTINFLRKLWGIMQGLISQSFEVIGSKVKGHGHLERLK